MSWFKDSLNPKEETPDVDKSVVAKFSLNVNHKRNPYEFAVFDIDEFEQIDLDAESLDDGVVNVITDKPTDVSK